MEAITALKENLTTIRDDDIGQFEGMGPFVPPQAVDSILPKYANAVSSFVANVDQLQIEQSIKPYEMKTLQRIVNFITGGWLFSAEKRQEKNSMKLKDELLEIKQTPSPKKESLQIQDEEKGNEDPYDIVTSYDH